MSTVEQRISAHLTSQKHLLDPFSYEFAARMYEGGIGKYERRLRQMGFDRCTHVFDAGSGTGQWSIALSSMVKNVTATDIQEGRVFLLDGIAKALGINNLRVEYGSLEKLRFETDSFDGILCYGVIFTTANWRASIRELARVLKPGGKLYVNANGVGYYKHVWQNEPNKSKDHDPKKWAALAFYNTWRMEKGLDPVEWPLHIIPPGDLEKELADAGFVDIVRKGEGEYRDPDFKGESEPSFMKGEYGGDLGVFEIVAKKR